MKHERNHVWSRDRTISCDRLRHFSGTHHCRQCDSLFEAYTADAFEPNGGWQSLHKSTFNSHECLRSPQFLYSRCQSSRRNYNIFKQLVLQPDGVNTIPAWRMTCKAFDDLVSKHVLSISSLTIL